ncbi:nucleoside-diphosphate kinase [Anaplasmataceae bacterium AB001_6]|nr:nucleoside-diphosphate kinase [Anaplasmataceae bacterium AB001_6]
MNSIERTLAIIKPDAFRKKIIGKIINYIEDSGLDIVECKLKKLKKSEVEDFYSVHKERDFFPDLLDYMISDKVVILLLEGYNAIQKYRDLMGNTDPKLADKGTIRGDFADNISENCVHGSDSKENAKIEIRYFFGI